MSILSTNPDNFNIRLGDVAARIDIGIALRNNEYPLLFYNRDDCRTIIENELRSKIKQAVGNLECRRPTIFQITQIVNEVTGLDLSIQCKRHQYPRGTNLADMFEFCKANTVDKLLPMDNRYEISYFNICVRYNTTAPHNGYLF